MRAHDVNQHNLFQLNIWHNLNNLKIPFLNVIIQVMIFLLITMLRCSQPLH